MADSTLRSFRKFLIGSPTFVGRFGDQEYALGSTETGWRGRFAG
jgi:hypothetical protein